MPSFTLRGRGTPAFAAFLFLAACVSTTEETSHDVRTGVSGDEHLDVREERSDPTKGEVSLPCSEGWHASLILDNGETGIWTVKPFHVFTANGCPEVIGLDDRGHCWICVSYSGKWTPFVTIEEKKWLGGLAQGDVDPRFPGDELYTGGQRGNLYQVRSYDGYLTDHRLIAQLPGREIHTIVAGDLDPRTEGAELLVFTRPGGLYRVTPTGPDGAFETEHLEDLIGRVRDAVVLPGRAGGPARIATVSRAGSVELLTMTENGPVWKDIHRSKMGRGRLSARMLGDELVLYTTQDDGRIMRHVEGPDGEWTTETIFLGPQGARGCAAGRFYDDPEIESVAIFGYSRKVELLSRRPGEPWTVETIFVDRDKGHWLSVAEVDGRNGTDELVGSGYGGRMFLLSRPPGYGRDETTDEPEPHALRGGVIGLGRTSRAGG